MSKLKTALDAQDAIREAGQQQPAKKQPGLLRTLVERLGPARNRAEARAQMFDKQVAGGGKGGSFHHPQGPEKRSRRGRRRKAALKAKARRARHAA